LRTFADSVNIALVPNNTEHVPQILKDL